jgi:ketosteroid isomerase-like protein
MKSHSIVAALSLLVAAPTQAQEIGKTSAAVTSLIEQFSSARNHFDAKALDNLLSPDYVEISPRGEIDRRPQVLGFYAPDKASPVPPTTIGTQDVRVHGDIAIVIGSVSYTLAGPTGGTVERTLRVTYVARRIGGHWLMASTQFTGVQPPKPAP